ncbi:MAG: TetR/AcrR family transcriptional regulator [Kordiimonadaceae bacterium]|nr:TetR/AcrR family transcriptional regulator [Kordiimonadaceae bacterium]
MPSRPRQVRSRKTYNKLVEAAGLLVAEVGIERTSSNAVAAKAGLTPPAFYRYFANKYEILAELAHGLMEHQNTLLVALLEDVDDIHGSAQIRARVGRLLSDTIDLTDQISGGAAIMRSMRAIPQLEGIRLESHSSMAAVMTDAAIARSPKLDRDTLYRQNRLAIEIGYAAIELAFDEPTLARGPLVEDCAVAIESMHSGLFS